jgi:Fur family ferric uptake transcriptional regulator
MLTYAINDNDYHYQIEYGFQISVKMTEAHKKKHPLQVDVFRWTLARKAILDLLSNTSKHLSVKEIYNSLSVLYPKIGLSTVYRTLDLLAQSNLINKLDIGDGKSRYEYKPDMKKAHHHHLVCTKCGKIIDYSDFTERELKLFREAEKKIAGKHDFQVQEHSIEFYGLCKRALTKR